MGLLSWLRGAAKQKQPPDARYRLGGTFYYEADETSNGYGGYRKVNVCLRRTDNPSFCRRIVDGRGHICGFPGIRRESITEELQFPADGVVRFRFAIEAFRDGRALVSWTLQPDGRYFEDEDGFGAEHCEEIVLYSYLDENGRFTEPFACRDSGWD